jgi:RNA 2',3'-cyclic 3'-phosphodiesterase
MAEQFNLPGFDIPSPSAPPQPRSQRPVQRGARLPHSLFFALVPSPEDVQRIAQVAKTLRAAHGLTGKLLLPERLHVTLRDLGGYEKGVPDDVVAAAKAAAAAVMALAMPRFDVTFDRLLHFPASRAVVLRSGIPSVPLTALAQTLGLAVQQAGLRTKPGGTAHMTLMYDERGVPEHGIEPVGWAATEFVLIHSLVGKTEHLVLGRWSLPG